MYFLACLVSYFRLEPQNFEENSSSQLPGSVSADYKYLHARKLPHQLSFNCQIVLDCIRHITGVFCCNFKSQTNIFASY